MKGFLRSRRSLGWLAFLLVAGAAAVFAGVQPITLPAVIDFLSGDEDVRIYGADANDQLGRGNADGEKGVLAADLNGDGVLDLVLAGHDADGPGNARNLAGEAYVYFGPFSPGTKDVEGIEGAAPDVVIYGAETGDSMTQWGMLASGDVNGDGIADLLLGARNADGPGNLRGNCGEVYVIYGSAALPAAIDIASSGEDVTIYGATANDLLGGPGLIQTGDVNGDGIADILLGAYSADGPGDGRNLCGEAYVIYGSAAIPAVIDLANGDEDITVYGATTGDSLCINNTLRTGDVNGDGITDILLGAYLADGPANGRNSCGEAYVIYGNAALPATIDLAANEEDVTIYGALSNDYLTGTGAIQTGDVNGDGIDDILLGAYLADGPADGRINCGEAYVIYGNAALPATIDIASSGEDVTIYGATAGDYLSSYGAMQKGDVNGDGIDDILLGAYLAAGPGDGRAECGEAYVIYGIAGLPATIDLASNEEDVTIYGASAYDNLSIHGSILSGDVNGDGLADILLGSRFGDGPAEGRNSCGEAYVINGSAALPAVIDLANGDEDVTVYGATESDSLNHQAGLLSGDINDDGLFDILMAAYYADGPLEARATGGEVYGIFGAGNSATAVVKDTDHAGNPLVKDYGTARAKIDFGSGAAASTTTVKLTRNDNGVNMPDLTKVADVNWTVTTNRANFSAKTVFHYLDSEIAGLVEGDLKLYKAATVGGTYSEVAGAVFDTVRNTVTATGLTGFSVFILSTVAPAQQPPAILGCFVDAVSPNASGTIPGGRALFPALALAGLLGAFFFIRRRR